jgi:hypothetical protein
LFFSWFTRSPTPGGAGAAPHPGGWGGAHPSRAPPHFGQSVESFKQSPANAGLFHAVIQAQSLTRT